MRAMLEVPQIAYLLTFLLLLNFSLLLMETAGRGRTPGKMLRGLYVVLRHGGKIGFSELPIRKLVRLKYLPGKIAEGDFLP